jgi:tetratricopeptide (TPR) repeat protein
MASPAGNALSLIKAVLELVADRRTGVLDVRSDGLRTQIYFDGGKPLFAEDEAPGETFGRLLMRQGVISNEQFVRVIDEMTRAAAGNNQLRFGEVAVALGVLTPEQVERGLAEQVCGIITRSLQRGESQWTFEPPPTAAGPPRSFSLQIKPAIVAALAQSSDRAMVADVVAARPEELVVVAGPRPAADVRDGGGGAAADTHTARIAAEQSFQKGLALLRETKAAAAAIELRRAAELQPESLEYLLYATWARARSYREMPTESDRQALLEIAQQAKRRDPMFAFASYVIGQVAMWAGDDATAKKWFYEALRLDPASEAGQQVRILARRGTASPAPPRQETEDRDNASEQAPGPAAPPVPARAQPARAPSRGGWGRWLLAGATLAATAALVYLSVARESASRAGRAPAAAPQPALAADAAPTAASANDDASGATASAGDAGPATQPDDDDAHSGVVLLPPRAAGHRIFVDGRRAKTDQQTTEGVAPLRLRCGPHVIQIGSGGTPESIDLPCRGQVQLQ